MVATNILQVYGATRRRGRRHVIPICHEYRRLGSHQTIERPRLSRGYFLGQLRKVGSPRYGIVPKTQPGRKALSTLATSENAYDRATITRTVKVPAVEEVPDALKSCYVDGILSYPRHLKAHAWVQRYVKVERYSDSESDPNFKFLHRLAFNAKEFPVVTTLGKGGSKVRFA
jgi:hypothetical protein